MEPSVRRSVDSASLSALAPSTERQRFIFWFDSNIEHLQSHYDDLDHRCRHNQLQWHANLWFLRFVSPDSRQ